MPFLPRVRLLTTEPFAALQRPSSAFQTIESKRPERRQRSRLLWRLSGFKDDDDCEGRFFEAHSLGASLLSGCRFTECPFRSSRLEGASLERSSADCDLTGTRLGGASIRECVFVRCALTNARFSGATLSSSRFIECDLGGAGLGGAQIAGGDFSHCDLSGEDLDGMALRGVRLLSTDLRCTRFVGADLRDAAFERTLLAGAPR